MKEGGAAPPLFLLHQGLDELLRIPVLARQIDPGIPVYGLHAQPPGRPPLRTVEGTAIGIVRIIRGVQPAGPYHIVGLSSAGTAGL